MTIWNCSLATGCGGAAGGITVAESIYNCEGTCGALPEREGGIEGDEMGMGWRVGWWEEEGKEVVSREEGWVV